MLAFSFAHGFIFRLESSAGAAGIGAAHSGPGVARVWFQRRFIRRFVRRFDVVSSPTTARNLIASGACLLFACCCLHAMQ